MRFCHGSLPADVTEKNASDAQVASTFLPDAWSCREGSITLSAGKDIFQALGLPGTKLSARMPGAPEQYRMPTFRCLYICLTLYHIVDSDQHLTGYTKHERSKPRVHSRFVYTVGPVTGGIW